MATYDWIVIGNGMTGAALSYELVRRGFSVLLLERNEVPDNATRYSYGGIAHWAGQTPLIRQLCREGLNRHRVLPEELGAPTGFREIDLLLTIAPESDPEQMALNYSGCDDPPIFLTASQACEMEPLLNKSAIAAALTIRQGHVDPPQMVQAYNQAFQRLGGSFAIATVTGLAKQGDRVLGVETATGLISAAHVAVCAGGMSRVLLKQAGISVPIYYSHAELLETPPVDLELQTMVMPAEMRRFDVEAQAGDPAHAVAWDQPDQEIVPGILDPGVVQFSDRCLKMGQMTRVLSNPQAEVDAKQSEASLRDAIGAVLPSLRSQPGTWHRCLVAFGADRLPLVGPLAGREGLHLFSGFSSPLAILPAVAQRFAAWAAGKPEPLIQEMTPARFERKV